MFRELAKEFLGEKRCSGDIRQLAHEIANDVGSAFAKSVLRPLLHSAKVAGSFAPAATNCPPVSSRYIPALTPFWRQPSLRAFPKGERT